LGHDRAFDAVGAGRLTAIRKVIPAMEKSDIRVQLRIVPLIGPGKMQLLDAIERFGSISGAARDMGIAYPNAWKLIDSMNRHFRDPLVTRVVGGKRGGGASLTETGRAVLNIFRSMEAKVKILLASDLDALSYLLAPEAPADGCPVAGSNAGSPDCVLVEAEAVEAPQL
jgi:molybdate transport system regulatory protein